MMNSLLTKFYNKYTTIYLQHSPKNLQKTLQHYLFNARETYQFIIKSDTYSSQTLTRTLRVGNNCSKGV